MKISFLALALIASTFCFSAPQPVFAEDAPVAISAEVSAVLLSPGFATAVRTETTKAAQSGQTLRIDTFDILDLGEAKFVYVKLITKNSSDFAGKWLSAGTMTAQISYGPLGEVIVDGVWFTPDVAGPGGASVGNN